MKYRPRQGFTLIEIVIVLAIAGIVMATVFLGVNGAQRAQRDNDRRDYVQRALAKIQEYRSNNAGNSTGMVAADLVTYMNNRLINNINPTITQDGAIPSANCLSGGSAGAVIQFSGGAIASQEYVAACLEVNQWYVVQSQ